MRIRLLIILLLAHALTMTAQRGCRVGQLRQSSTLTRSQDSTRQPGGDFYQGDRRQLVVLAAFSDVVFRGTEAETMAQWDKILNAEGLQEAPFVGSVHDYFYSQSYGLLDLHFDLQYVQLADKVTKYRSWDKGYGDSADDDENSQYLVNDIVDALSQRDIDWNRYDWNGDGQVNQLLIIFAGKGMNNGGGKNSIWPHQWWLSEHRKDRQTGTYCEPRTVNGQGKNLLVDCYCALAELTGVGDYGTFGTICHEYTHCFGFPDFYNERSYVGGWDLMDSGNFNGNGYCPPCYSAHERWLMGWLTPVELTGETQVEQMQALTEQATAYLVRNEGYANEYYIVENRQPSGWDASLPGSGIVVFHIDFEPSVWAGTDVWPNAASRMRYTIIPANNAATYSLSNAREWTYPWHNNSMLTNTSQPAATLWHANTDGSLLMNKPITEMAVDGDGKASFLFGNDETAVRVKSLKDVPTVLYDYGPIRIVRNPDGTIKKVMKH